MGDCTGYPGSEIFRDRLWQHLWKMMKRKILMYRMMYILPFTGLTWLHNELPGRMQLVDSGKHQACRHIGGSSLWGGGQEST